jgi:hypothetical protein
MTDGGLRESRGDAGGMPGDEVVLPGSGADELGVGTVGPEVVCASDDIVIPSAIENITERINIRFLIKPPPIIAPKRTSLMVADSRGSQQRCGADCVIGELCRTYTHFRP